MMLLEVALVFSNDENRSGQLRQNRYNTTMLTPYSRSQFVTKILTSPSGEKFSVVFLVALVNGEVKAQMVSATLVSVEKPASVCLPISSTKSPTTFTYTPSSTQKISLFDSLFFFNSQPTRAPSLQICFLSTLVN